jgi:glutamine amidotransferase
MHNGSIADFHKVRRDLMMAIDPTLFADIEGSTDSEALFYLALTFGLTDDPPGAVERAVGLVEEVGHRHGIAEPIQMTVATTDGSSIWAFRYSSVGASRSLYYSTDVVALRKLHPEVPVLRTLSDEARLVVSEPLGDLTGAWNEVPEASWGVVRAGQDDLQPFRPVPAA